MRSLLEDLDIPAYDPDDEWPDDPFDAASRRRLQREGTQLPLDTVDLIGLQHATGVTTAELGEILAGVARRHGAELPFGLLLQVLPEEGSDAPQLERLPATLTHLRASAAEDLLAHLLLRANGVPTDATVNLHVPGAHAADPFARGRRPQRIGHPVATSVELSHPVGTGRVMGLAVDGSTLCDPTREGLRSVEASPTPSLPGRRWLPAPGAAGYIEALREGHARMGQAARPRLDAPSGASYPRLRAELDARGLEHCETWRDDVFEGIEHDEDEIIVRVLARRDVDAVARAARAAEASVYIIDAGATATMRWHVLFDQGMVQGLSRQCLAVELPYEHPDVLDADHAAEGRFYLTDNGVITPAAPRRG